MIRVWPSTSELSGPQEVSHQWRTAHKACILNFDIFLWFIYKENLPVYVIPVNLDPPV
jgi:hypothetical protein